MGVQKYTTWLQIPNNLGKKSKLIGFHSIVFLYTSGNQLIINSD